MLSLDGERGRGPKPNLERVAGDSSNEVKKMKREGTEKAEIENEIKINKTKEERKKGRHSCRMSVTFFPVFGTTKRRSYLV